MNIFVTLLAIALGVQLGDSACTTYSEAATQVDVMGDLDFASRLDPPIDTTNRIEFDSATTDCQTACDADDTCTGYAKAAVASACYLTFSTFTNSAGAPEQFVPTSVDTTDPYTLYQKDCDGIAALRMCGFMETSTEAVSAQTFTIASNAHVCSACSKVAEPCLSFSTAPFSSFIKCYTYESLDGVDEGASTTGGTHTMYSYGCAPPTTPPVNCVYSEYVNSTCSATCGNGTMTSTRTKEVEGANGGIECDDSTLTITSECNLGACAADTCVITFGEWGACNATTCMEYRSGSVAANINGTDNVTCSITEDDTSRPCSDPSLCSVVVDEDCVYSDYVNSTCSTTCGDGTLTMTRTKVSEAQGAGVPCDDSTLTMTADCNEGVCPCVFTPLYEHIGNSNMEDFILGDPSDCEVSCAADATCMGFVSAGAGTLCYLLTEIPAELHRESYTNRNYVYYHKICNGETAPSTSVCDFLPDATVAVGVDPTAVVELPVAFNLPQGPQWNSGSTAACKTSCQLLQFKPCTAFAWSPTDELCYMYSMDMTATPVDATTDYELFNVQCAVIAPDA